MKWIIFSVMILFNVETLSQCDSLYISSETNRIDDLEITDEKNQSLTKFIEELIDNQCYTSAISQQIRKIELSQEYYPDYFEYQNLLLLDTLIFNYSTELSTESRNSYLIKNLLLWADFNERKTYHSRTIEKYDFIKSNSLIDIDAISDDLLRQLEIAFRNVGIEYFSRKEYGIAIDYLNSAVELSDIIKYDLARLSRGSTNRGYITFIYLSMDDLPESKQIFYDHLNIANIFFAKDSGAYDHLLTAYERLIQLHLIENNLDSASLYLNQFENIELKYKDTRFESTIFKIRILQKQGKTEMAKILLEQLFKLMYKKNIFSEIVNYQENLMVIGLLIDAGLFEMAQTLLDFIDNKNNQAEEAGITNNMKYYSTQKNYLYILLASLKMNKNIENDSLIFHMRKVYDIIDEGIKNSSTKDAKLTFASQSAEYTDFFLKNLIRYDNTNNDDIFYAIESSKSAALFKSWLQNQMSSFDAGKGIFFEEKIMENKIRKIHEELSIPTMPSKKEELDIALDQFANSIDSIMVLLKDLHPAYYKMKYNWSIPKLSEVQNSLSTDEVLINYFEGSDMLYAMVIANDNCQMLTIDSISILRDSIADYYDNIQEEKHWTRHLSNTSNYIYQKIVAPLEPYLKERLVISPSGSLCQVPFSALNTSNQNDDFHYLFQDYAISYSPSGSFFHQLRELDKSNIVKKGLFVAPIFPEIPPSSSEMQIAMRSNLDPLEFNVPEVKSISRYVDSEIRINEDAVKEYALELMTDADIIHLATHAKSNMDAPEKSFVAFSMPTDMSLEEDYKWYLDDISKHSLPAKMIVLSACETSLGRIFKGEGAMSLANSCFYAGAQSVVASLWSAEDNSASVIMSYFYKFLDRGFPKDKALQMAQIEYTKSSSGTKINPYYWAGFSVMGSTDALQFEKTPNYRNWVFALFAWIALILFYPQLKSTSQE